MATTMRPAMRRRCPGAYLASRFTKSSHAMSASRRSVADGFSSALARCAMTLGANCGRWGPMRCTMIVRDLRKRRRAAASPPRSSASPMTSHVKCGRRKSGTDGVASAEPELDAASRARVSSTVSRRPASACSDVTASSAPADRINVFMSSFL